MNVTPTRMGWCRWSTGGIDGAARLFESDGRFMVVELIAAGDMGGWPLDAAAEVSLWAAGPGAQVAAAMLAERATTPVHVVGRVDATERAEPSRRMAWSIAAEAGQKAMLALILDMPEERFKSNVFYEEVVAAYKTAVIMFGRGEAHRRMAEANDVNVVKVYAWLKEARRRGLMEPARAGAA